MNMNIKMPDFDVKKFVKDAGSTLSRVVQVGIENHAPFGWKFRLGAITESKGQIDLSICLDFSDLPV